MLRTSSKIRILFLTPLLVLLLGAVAYLQIGPGTTWPTGAPLSDQKVGSVLLYNLYTSSATNPLTTNTELSITNTNTTTGVSVHLFFVNAANNRAADTFIALAPKQTMSLLASEYDPGIRGYMMAVAVDSSTGCPISFNHLIGDAYIKLVSGHTAALGAQAFSALYAGVLGGCSNLSTSAVLNFDGNTLSGSGYNQLPRTLLTENIPSRADGNDTLLVYNRIGGSFVQGSSVSTTGTLFGVLYDDSATPFSFLLPNNAQNIGSLSSNFPRLTPRFDTLIVPGRSGWLKFFNPNSDFGITGAIINYNPNVGSNVLAYEGGYNLRTATLSTANSLTVPVSPPNASVDLTVGVTSSSFNSSSFNIGTPATYTITVTNPGARAASGSIAVYGTLPNNLTLASVFSLNGVWSCTGTNTVNFYCTNTSGLAANASLPPLTLTVNVGAGTPANISTTVTVSNVGDNNPANDSVTNNATVTSLTTTTTAVTSSLPTSTVGQTVSFIATVTGTGGPPTGSVDFFSLDALTNATTSLGSATLSSGTATLNTAALPVGLYVVQSVYSGSGSFAPSRSSVIQTVNAASQTATTTTLTSPTIDPSVVGQTVTFNVTVTPAPTGSPAGSANVRLFDGATQLGTVALTVGGTATFSTTSLLLGSHSITAQYLGNPSFAGSTSAVLARNVIQTDVGAAYPAAAELSDQKTGAVLIYNYYTSSVISPTTQNTELSLTNTNTTTGVTVHLFFVNSVTSRAADTFVTLLPNQTMSLLASDYDLGVTGYVIAVAVDSGSGCPTGFNFLQGDAFVKQSVGHRAYLPAQAVSALFSGPLAGCVAPSTVLNFDGVSYNLLPRTVAVDNIPSRTQSNDTFLIVNRIGGSFLSGFSAGTTGTLFGILYDDAESPYSFAINGNSQVRGSLSDAFPRLNPRFTAIVPAGRSGWMKLFNPNSDFPLVGAVLNFNANSFSQANAFNTGQNLRVLTLAGPQALTIPVTATNTTVDLAAGLSGSNFNIGKPGTYTITVNNIGTRAATGTITVYDTLPANLSFASFSGTGWSCSGTTTVTCTNSNGLAASSSLPTLTLTVNVGAGTPANVTNTITVVNAADNNPANDMASATNPVASLTATTTTVGSSLPTSTFGQNVTFTATVTGTTPTGTVQFFDGVTSLGSASLSGGSASLSTAALTVGPHSISAVYAGDVSFASSTSTVFTQIVNASSRAATTSAVVSSINPTFLGQSTTFTATVTSGSTPTGTVQFFDGVTSLGTRTLASGQATLGTGALTAGAHAITVQFLGDPTFAPSTSPVLTQTVNQTDVGIAYPASAEFSDQKTGSVLIYNYYTSSSTNPTGQNTELSLTNTNTAGPVTVRLFFVDATGRATDTFVTLQANQTTSLLASTIDPGVSGYVIAVAVDSSSGCPLGFNFLQGDAYIKQLSGHRANLAAQAVAAQFAGPLAGCSSPSATLNFNGTSYNLLPRSLVLDNIPSRTEGNDTLLIVNRIGGSLVAGSSAATTGSLFGMLYDDGEAGYSFGMGGGVQVRGSLSDSFPRIVPRLSLLIPAGRSGWMKFFNPNNDNALLGAAINFNANSGTLANAYNWGQNLRALTLAGSNSLTIPVSAPNLSTDLTLGVTHAGFNVGSPGSFTITVNNVSLNQASGTIRVFGTLPNNLTVNGSISGTGWACANAGANIACSNNNGLAANTSLPPLTIPVAVGAGTPANISTTFTVFNVADNIPGNNSATDNATVTNRTVTTTSLNSSLPTATFGQTVTFTATVSGTTPTGTVQFLDNGSLLGSGTLSGSTAVFSTAGLSVGTHLITAVYGGDATFAPSTSTGFTQTVNDANRVASTTSLSPSNNPSVLGEAVTLTAGVASGPQPFGLVQFFDGATLIGSQTVNGNGSASVVISNLTVGTHLITAQYLGSPQILPSTSAVLSQVVNQTDVGLTYPQTAESSDQKTGSVLLYNYYRSSTATPATDNTEFSLTNTSASLPVTVHLFFVRGGTGVAADTFLTLPPNRTTTFLASNFDPDAVGYVMAVAVNNTGCPINFNALMGDAAIKLPTGQRVTLGAQAFSALYAGSLSTCTGGPPNVSLNFDGVSYNQLPRTVAVNNIAAPSDGNSTRLVVNNIGGSFLFGANAASLGSFQGVLYDDAETAFVWSANHTTTQFSALLNNSFPLVAPPFNTTIAAGRSGWMKLFATNNSGLTGASLNFNANTGTQASAFNYGENLHQLTLASAVSVTIPLYVPTTLADVFISKTHSGSFTSGSTGTYTINVGNMAGFKNAAGTIRVTDTLPNNLTLASFSGTGWTCTGTGTANVVCDNLAGLAAGNTLPPLTLTVNVNAGTPSGVNSIVNTATATLYPLGQEANPANNVASDPTTILCNYTVSPTYFPVVSGGESNTVNVTALAGCAWQAVSNAPWLSITSGSNGSGNGSVNFNAVANPDPAPRTGTLTVAGQTVTVYQAAVGILTATDFTGGIPPDWQVIDGGTGTYPGGAPLTWTSSNPCNRTIPAPFSGQFAIVDSACAEPSAVPDEQLITPVFDATGAGEVIVRFNNQFHWLAGGANEIGDVDVTTDNGQTWTNVLRLQGADDGWPTPNTKNINITSAIAANPANVRVRFHYYINGSLPPAGEQRQGQPGVPQIPTIQELWWGLDGVNVLNFKVAPISANVPGAGGTGNINVLAGAGVTWQARSDVPWAHVLTTGGSGSGSLAYTVDANLGLSRTGTLIVADNTFTINQGLGCLALGVLPATLPSGLVGVSYNQTLTGMGGTAPYSFMLDSGTLPATFSLASNGTLTGVPAASGVSNFVVKVTDANGCTGTQSYSLIICATLAINPASLPNGFVGTPYSQTFTQTGGSGAITWSVSTGSLPSGLNLNPSGGTLTGTPTASGTFNFTIKATDANGCMGTRVYSVLVSGNGLQFYPLPAPVRLLDTRTGTTACSQPNAPIAGQTSLTQVGRNICSIPTNAVALTGNVTTVNSGGGFLTLYPSNATQPTVASTNYAPNEIVNNVFTVGLGTDGAFKIFAFNTTDVVVDVTGYYAPPATNGLFFHPLPKPIRLLETRTGQLGCTTPGAPVQGGDAGTRTQQARITCDGVTIPAGALAIVGNATTVSPQGGGFLTLFPGNATRPLVASSNYATGQIVNGPFSVGLAPNGEFKIYSFATTDLVVDVLGYYSTEATDANGAGLLFSPLAKPVRLLETRADQTVGCFKPGAPLNGEQEYTQTARGLCDGVTIPANALGVVGNATVVQPLGPGFLTLWPSSAQRPLVATANYNVGDVGNRHFIVGLGNSDGAFRMYTFATSHLVVDLSGYFAP